MHSMVKEVIGIVDGLNWLACKLSDYQAMRLSGYQAIRLSGYQAIQSCLAIRKDFLSVDQMLSGNCSSQENGCHRIVSFMA